jgi:hypothetical protein
MHKAGALKKSEANREEFLHSFGVCFIDNENDDMVVTFDHDIVMSDNDLAVTDQRCQGRSWR